MSKKIAKAKLTGDKQLIAKLKRLSDVGRSAVLETAVRAGAMPIENGAKEKAPFLAGILRSSIHTEVTSTGTSAKAEIGTDVPYAAQREFGGTITAKNAPFLAFRINGRWVRVRSVTQKATPYLRPSFDENSDKAVAEIAETLKAAINNVI